MTTLAGRSEAFELDSKAGSPETLSPLEEGRTILSHSELAPLVVCVLRVGNAKVVRHHPSPRSHSSRRWATPSRRAAAAKTQKLGKHLKNQIRVCPNLIAAYFHPK